MLESVSDGQSTSGLRGGKLDTYDGGKSSSWDSSTSLVGRT